MHICNKNDEKNDTTNQEFIGRLQEIRVKDVNLPKRGDEDISSAHVDENIPNTNNSSFVNDDRADNHKIDIVSNTSIPAYLNQRHSFTRKIKSGFKDILGSRLSVSGVKKDISPFRNNEENNQDIQVSIRKSETFDNNLKELLQEWLEFCETNSILHAMNSSYLKKCSNIISIIAILLSTLSGSSNIATSNENASAKETRIMSLLFGSVSLVSGALITVQKYLNLSDLQTSHSFYANQYTKLKNEINMQLFIYECDSKTFVNLTEFCKVMKHSLDSIIDRAPSVNEKMIKQFNKNKKKIKTVNYPSLLFLSKKNES
jgi:hypothetical protein